MIKVRIKIENNKFESLELKGHSNYSEKGSDIVCAGVSAVFVGGLNNLRHPENYELVEEEGYGLIKVIKTEDEHDRIVIETIIQGLKSIEEAYNSFIKINLV